MEHGFTGEAEALRNAASSYFEDFRLDVLGRSRGYSESEFARVEASTGTWLLRRWPPGFGEGRLRFVHQALLESRSRGFRGVPSLAKTADGDTVARMAGYLYDAQEWTAGRSLSGMPGGDGPAPNVAARVPPRTLLALAEAVARFHASTARLRPELAPEVEPLAIRLGELGSELDRSPPALGAGVRDRADDTTRGIATGWLGLLPQTLGSAREASLSLDGDRECLVLCHGDLWPTHAYFRGSVFAGFTDFEALSLGPPTLDLAQLIAHFGGWEIQAQATRSYGRIAPLTERQRATLPFELLADLASEGIWSLQALYLEPSNGLTRAQRTAHAHNLRVLLGCLGQISKKVNPRRGNRQLS